MYFTHYPQCFFGLVGVYYLYRESGMHDNIVSEFDMRQQLDISPLAQSRGLDSGHLAFYFLDLHRYAETHIAKLFSLYVEPVQVFEDLFYRVKHRFFYLLAVLEVYLSELDPCLVKILSGYF
jgi:hypothetical protein